VERKCELCKRENVRDPPDETFAHLFRDCNIARKLKQGFLNHGFQEWVGINDAQWSNLWFFGIVPGGEGGPQNIFILTVFTLCNFYIWELKLRKKRGSIAGFINEVTFMLRGILKASSKINEARANLHYNFCRQLE
jgi:hypothetical protein